MRKRKFFESILIYLGLVGISVFALFPFVWMVLTSLKNKNEVYTVPLTWIPKHLTWQNYHNLLNLGFYRYFLNSIFVASVVTLITVFISILAAYGFSRFRFKGRDILFASTLMGYLLPISVMILPIYILISKIKLIDTYSSLIIVYISIVIPFSVWILTGYIDTIPRDLDDAAMIDGCTRIRVLFNVLVPPAMPGIVAVGLFAFITAWQEFLFALILINSMGKWTLPLAMVSFIGQIEINWGSMMAAALITTLPLTIIFVFLQGKLISGLTGGAVKE
ncbi:MAG: carbohydrate ABC transporter permease [Actinobacteria bacterium]|nr:carbohydrate ABC transporter permease [Actinomycetota bacterium]